MYACLYFQAKLFLCRLCFICLILRQLIDKITFSLIKPVALFLMRFEIQQKASCELPVVLGKFVDIKDVSPH